MVRAAIIALLLLAGCGEASSDSDQIEADLHEVRSQAAGNRADIDRLEADLEARLEVLEKAHDNLVEIVSHNADIANQNANVISENAKAANQNSLRDMTRRGACGTESVSLPNGGVVLRNKECTEKDMR